MYVSMNLLYLACEVRKPERNVKGVVYDSSTLRGPKLRSCIIQYPTSLACRKSFGARVSNTHEHSLHQIFTTLDILPVPESHGQPLS